MLLRVAEYESISLDNAASLVAISSILADNSELALESPRILASSTALSLNWCSNSFTLFDRRSLLDSAFSELACAADKSSCNWSIVRLYAAILSCMSAV